jgi:hypothetical protein
VRLFGPALPFAAAAQGGYQPVAIEPLLLRDRARAQESALAAALRGFAPDLLVADCYWAPLAHLLPLPGCEAWLLARWLPATWFSGPPEARFEPRRYRKILAIEPHRVPHATGLVPPVVICNPGEARPPGSLRAHLGVPSGQRLRVVAHAGLPGEAQTLAAGAGANGAPGGTFSAVLSLHDADALFPLAEWLGDADEVVSAAGYNSYWEARWMGTTARTRFTALDRQRPEQEWRLRACGGVSMRDNGADVLAAMITAG